MLKYDYEKNNIHNINNNNNNNNNNVSDVAIVSYGLICFFKKKFIVNNNVLHNNNINKKTKKNEDACYKKINNKLYKHIYINSISWMKTNIDKKTENNIQVNNITTPVITILKRNGPIPQKNTVNININTNTLDNITLDNITITNTITNANANEIIKDTILLVQRKYTIGFIEFMRGKYDVHNHEYIIKLFNMMTFNEKQLFKDYTDFDDIRNHIGLTRDIYYKIEYNNAKYKFYDLKNHINGNMVIKLLEKSFTKWTEPEWGIPKGRKHSKETELNCAIREFVEETGIQNKNLNIFRNVKPLEEIYRGINGIIYKHIYYLATIKDTEDAIKYIEHIETQTQTQLNYEISNVKLFNVSECNKTIRPYYVSKLNVIHKGFQIINNLNYYFE